VGVIATHDEYPIERLALDRSAKWLASVSHDECIKLTDCEGIFEDDSGAEDVEMADSEADEAMEQDSDSDEEEPAPAAAPVDWGSDSDDEQPQPKAKKQKKGQHKIGKDRINDEEAGFFDDL
jgi:hypothetical protein